MTYDGGGDQIWVLGDGIPYQRTLPVSGYAAVAAAPSGEVSFTPADGPKLAPISLKTPVYPKPDKTSDAVGYLRVGAKVARTPDPAKSSFIWRPWPISFPRLSLRAPITRPTLWGRCACARPPG